MADHEQRQAKALERIADTLERIDKQLQQVPGQRKPPERPSKKKSMVEKEAEFYNRQEG